MDTSIQQVFDSFVRHQIHLIRVAGGLRNAGDSIISRTEKELNQLVIDYSTRIAGVPKVSQPWRDLIAEFSKKVRDLRYAAWKELETNSLNELKSYAKYELGFTTNTITTSLPVQVPLAQPPASFLIGVVEANPFEGRTLKEWMRRNRDIDVGRITTAAKKAFAAGKHPKVAAREVLGQGKKTATRKAVRDLESVLLTVINGIQSETREALYKQNGSVVKEEFFVATLDSKTTPICAENDNQRFKVGQGPIPPLHFRCRSLRVPAFETRSLAERPIKPVTEKMLVQEYAKKAKIGKVTSRGALPYGHKGKFDAYARTRTRELIGTVPADTSYVDFLKRQPKSFQEEFFKSGTRAELFRSGEVPLSALIGDDGNFLTFQELIAKGVDIPGYD